MAKHKRNSEEPRIEDFIVDPFDKPRSNRRSITLWLDGRIIDACKPRPAKVLRQWIEDNFPKEFDESA
jgi:hypothetical protein